MKAKTQEDVKPTPDEEVAQRRDDLIRRALRTPPTPLKEMKRKRSPRTGAPSSKRDDDA
jgi:hypothetical protein